VGANLGAALLARDNSFTHQLLRSLPAPKAAALPGCATPRLGNFYGFYSACETGTRESPKTLAKPTAVAKLKSAESSGLLPHFVDQDLRLYILEAIVDWPFGHVMTGETAS
jgi:hypothetical protein